MKKYKKCGYTVFEFEFQSANDFLRHLEQNPINTEFFHEGNMLSLRNDLHDDSWNKTKSYEEAVQLCRYGYHEDFDRLLRLKDILERFLTVTTKNYRQFNDYVGFAPDVKAYLEGSPLSMFNRVRPKRNKLSVYFNCANMGGVSAAQIFNRGAITLALVEALEKMRFNVDLNVFSMSEKQDEIHYAKFLLKKENERLNIKKLYFPMCHPAFFRRLIFRLREETFGVRQDWSQGYGSTCGEELITQVIGLEPNDIVICKPDELGIVGGDLLQDTETTLKYIEKKVPLLSFVLPKSREQVM